MPELWFWLVGLMFIVSLVGLYPLAYTSSKSSFAALLLGVLLLGFWRVARDWLARHHTIIFSVTLGGLALAIVTIIAVGFSTGGLPDDTEFAAFEACEMV